VQAEEVDLSNGLSPAELHKLIGKRDYREFLNPRNEMYRERDMKHHPPPREEAIRLMAENPNLVRRPILVADGRLILGFDEHEYTEAAK
jgi:arsenate reductase-like glutaredoxin family protein